MESSQEYGRIISNEWMEIYKSRRKKPAFHQYLKTVKEGRNMAVKKEGTQKRTKADILDEYETMKSKLEEMQVTAPADRKAEEMARFEDKTTVEKASSYSVEHIVKSLADLNLFIGKALNELTEKLNAEVRKLSDLQKAIDIETHHLEELRNIKVAGDTLSLLIEEYETKKKTLREEHEHEEESLRRAIEDRRAAWKKEQEEYELLLNERNLKNEKERAREKEEYDYSLNLQRKKEKDTYEQKKMLLERELAEMKKTQDADFGQRERALAEREAEFAELRKKAETFPSTIEEAVKKAADEARKAAEKKAEIEAKLQAKEVEGERNLQNLEIKNLKEMVKKQEQEITSLTTQLADAGKQVMTIAAHAIEGASGARTLSTVQEIAMEQAKVTKG